MLGTGRVNRCAGSEKKGATASAVFVFSVVFVTVPLFFERLHSDEVIYWDVASSLARGEGLVSSTLGGLFFWHAPLPFFLNAPALLVHDHILTTRVVSSLFTAGCAVLVYLVAEARERDGAVPAAILFILSFQALRYGGRFYLDQYGAFFFLLSLLLAMRGRLALSGLAALLMVLAREYWLGVYPFLAAFVLVGTGAGATGRRLLRFIAPSALAVFAVVPALAALGKAGTLAAFVLDGAVVPNLAATFTDLFQGPALVGITRGWAEFTVLNILVVAGFTGYVVNYRDYAPLLLVIPQAALISLVHGFVIDGGVTQYPLALTAAAAPFAGPGLVRLYRRLPFSGRAAFPVVFAAVTAVQFTGLNALATMVSLHGNAGVYGIGYGPDRAVIEKLRREARGEFINGIHGAFVPESAGWDWTDYRVAEAIDAGPDWLVTYSNYVEVLPSERWMGLAEVTEIGPYTVVHALEGGAVADVVREADFMRWKLRKD